MSEILVNTIKKADGTGSLSVPAESGTVVVKDGSNDVTLNNITATGVYLGGTGAANHLDDYEEGTWTPTFSDSASNTYTGSYGTRAGFYTKIGNVVTTQCYISATNDFVINGLSGSQEMWVTGLPFTIDQNPTQSTGHVDSTGPNLSSGYTTFGFFGRDNVSYVAFREMGDSIVNANMTVDQFNISTGRQLQFTMVYRV